MWTTIKALFQLTCVVIFSSLFFALPLWALWPWGPRVLGAPAIDFLTFATTLATLEILFVAVYFGVKFLRAAVKVVVASLPDPEY